MVKVVSLSEATGLSDNLIHVEKSSDDNCKLPEHLVSAVLVVTLYCNIASLNVTTILEATGTLVELSEGVSLEIVGAEVSPVEFTQLAPNFS